jgi:predicted amidophosphoribosyltransferase
MTSCVSCGADVTGKKFCPHCGTPVQAIGVSVSNQAASANVCPRCNGEVTPGAAFCMHCGSALAAEPASHVCPACQTEVPAGSAFCTNCGHDMRSGTASQAAPAFCTNCGQQNAPGVRFCGHCGSPMDAGAAQMASSGQYPPPPPPYQQYPQQYGQPQYAQQYVQPGGYQAQPMMGQGPMVLRCPTCMAMAPVGTPNCLSCRTSLAGIIPTPANMPAPGQQGGLGGFLQGSGGQMAMGALGGAAAVIGGEMLLHGIENSIENRVEGDMGYGYHHHHHRDEGLLGDLGDLANDIGL